MPPIESGDEAPGREGFESQELREELTEIGVILNLPAQRPKRATMSVQAVVPPRFNLAKLRALTSTCVIVIGVAIGVFSLRTPPAPYIPDLLLGEWATSNPSYEGRQLAFTETRIELGTQKDAPRLRYPITSLTTKTRGDTLVITLSYDEDGAPVELHARLITRPSLRLVFDRPYDLVWERRVKLGLR